MGKKLIDKNVGFNRLINSIKKFYLEQKYLIYLIIKK